MGDTVYNPGLHPLRGLTLGFAVLPFQGSQNTMEDFQLKSARMAGGAGLMVIQSSSLALCDWHLFSITIRDHTRMDARHGSF